MRLPTELGPAEGVRAHEWILHTNTPLAEVSDQVQSLTEVLGACFDQQHAFSTEVVGPFTEVGTAISSLINELNQHAAGVHQEGHGLRGIVDDMDAKLQALENIVNQLPTIRSGGGGVSYSYRLYNPYIRFFGVHSLCGFLGRGVDEAMGDLVCERWAESVGACKTRVMGARGT